MPAMALKPHCTETEWLRRAGIALAERRPDLTPAQVAEIVTGHLWEEACDWPPEEAVDEYLRDPGE